MPNGEFNEPVAPNTDPLPFECPKTDAPGLGSPNADPLFVGAPKTDADDCCAKAPNPEVVVKAGSLVPPIPKPDTGGAALNADD